MSLFGGSRPKVETAVLIDIAAGSVGGACAVYREKESPVVVYAKRFVLETRLTVQGGEPEPYEVAVGRALTSLVDVLIKEGSPALMRAAGTGTANRILVSLETGQTAVLHNEVFEDKDAFTFSKRLLATRLEKVPPPPGTVVIETALLNTLINGYDVPTPFGQRATRVETTLLISYGATQLVEAITSIVRQAYHTKEIALTTSVMTRQQALRTLFPLERDCLMLDSSADAPLGLFMRHGLLVKLETAPVTDCVARTAHDFPLPHTVFAIAREPLEEFTAKMIPCWPAENPPKIVSVSGEYLSGFLRNATDHPIDLDLAFLVLYGGHNSSLIV